MVRLLPRTSPAALKHSSNHSTEAHGFTGWTLGPDGSNRETPPEENEGWHDGSSITTQSHVGLVF